MFHKETEVVVEKKLFLSWGSFGHLRQTCLAKLRLLNSVISAAELSFSFPENTE